MMAAFLQRDLGDRFQVESAALWKKGIGDPTNENSILCMKDVGIDVSGHRVCWIGDFDLTQFSHIVCVNTEMAGKIRGFLEGNAKVLVVNEDDGGLPDPLGKGMSAYQACFAIIVRDLPRLASLIRG